uniref:Putative methyltransferase n=1 Tax=symbiont bacterium of Paederus fuscipes TaxID=176282 RepID=Q6VT96_UNCXX|nr:putative methyltransferase [symbiont bacterium of Paederus fuscipes]
MQTAIADVEKVATLYDSAEGQVGPILFGGHMHWGYWDEVTGEGNFANAAERLAQIMIAKAPIKAGQKFIDMGCGFGESALKLAKAKGCFVDGITISKEQQLSAITRAEAEQLQERVRFIHGSALNIPCEDQSYDGGWFFESIFHMGHRKALHEAARVLKPGSTLLLTDLPLLPESTEAFKEFVWEHIHSRFVSREDYPELLAEAEFELIEIDDITDNVMPWLEPKLKEAIELHRPQVEAIIPNDTEKAIDDWLYLFEYMSENLGYMIVMAKKL